MGNASKRGMVINECMAENMPENFKLGWKTPFLGMEEAKQWVTSTELCEHDMLNYCKEMSSILSKVCVQVKSAQGIPNHHQGSTMTHRGLKNGSVVKRCYTTDGIYYVSVQWRMLSLVLWLGGVPQFVVCMKIRDEEYNN